MERKIKEKSMKISESFVCAYNIYYSFGSMSTGSLTAETLKDLKKQVKTFKLANNTKDVEAIVFYEVTHSTYTNLGSLFKKVLRVKKPTNRFFKTHA